MKLKRLGRTDEFIPEIGLGTWNYLGDPAVIRESAERGGFLIDTAENYHTEEAVGLAISDNREDYFLATKVSPSNLRYDDVLKAADRSLVKLKTEYIDLYQIHGPNPGVPIEETMAAMDHLIKLGKIRYVGVSNFSVQQLKEAQMVLTEGNLVCNQVHYNLIRREIEEDLVPFCEENGVTIMAYTPLISGGFERAMSSRPELAQVIEEMCQLTGLTVAQLLLSWCIHNSIVVTIPQTNRVSRVIENCAASDLHLDDAQYAILSQAAIDSTR